MNSNKKDKSKSLREPFKKLFGKITSKSSSLAPDERSDGTSSTNLLGGAGQVPTGLQKAHPTSSSLSTDVSAAESTNKEASGELVISGDLGGTDPLGGQVLPGPVIPITGAQDSTNTASENRGDRNKEKADEDAEEDVTEEPSRRQRVAALAYEGLKESLRLVVRCTDSFPGVKSATQGVMEVLDRYDAVNEIPGELADLKDKLDALALIVQENDAVAIRDRLDGLARTFEEKIKIINTKLDRSMGARIIETTEDVKFMAREVRAITFAIEIVMVDVNLKTHTAVMKLHDIVLLDKLKYVEGAAFGHSKTRGKCAYGTCTLLLADLLAWATEPESEHVFWLNGMAGTGKTTVTETLCHLLDGKGILGSSFFCSRNSDIDGQKKVNLIIPSLACALAYKYSEFQKELIQVLQNCLDPTNMDLKRQFETLLMGPARIAFKNHSESIILVVDALDECEDQEAAEMLLRIILQEKSLGVLHFFITSRPETKIRKGFSAGTYAGVRLHDIEAHIVKADIKLYLLAALEKIEDLQSEYESGGGSWPPTELETIAEKSGNFFIYASTGVSYISDGRLDPVECLKKYASITPPSNAVNRIDAVYVFVLHETFYNLEADEKQRVQLCLQTVVCAMEPLSVIMYSLLLKISVLQVRRIFATLHSVVQIPEERKNDMKIVVYHASFPDYLTSVSRTKSAAWYIDVPSAHTMLLDQCLRIMTSKLCFNVVKATTSYQSNKDQQLQVEPDLEYTCGSWPDHLFKTVTQLNLIPEIISAKIEQFLLEKFLYWLEVLSVTNKAQYAAAFLSHIYRITESFALKNMCREFAIFTSKHLVAIKHSAPHIYLSALPWVASKSVLGMNFHPKFSHLPKIIDSKEPDAWEPLVVPLHGHTDDVNSIVYSPDSTHLASGSGDQTIRIWNAETGQQILQINLEGKNGQKCSVRSLAYSPNSQYIISGSTDATVRIWDANTGEPMFQPLLGHDKAIFSVAVSPNGLFIASGSEDKTVRLWDFETQKVHAVFSSQAKVKSVAFSSDSKFLVSGDHNCSITVWNVKTGDEIFKLQKNRKQYGNIYSVAFTPDGQSVLCALSSNEFFIWNLASDQEERIFSGHLSSVLSAAFSSSAAYVVSGSVDSTVRVWSAETRKELIPALSGHSKMIKCVAFAPNGNSVASGSGDHTINIWQISEALQHSVQSVQDSTQSILLSKPLETSQGHNDAVTSVAFSHDSQYVASGCTDNTIGVWNVNTGRPKFPPLEGHSRLVNTVAWSSDDMLIASGSADETIILWNADTGTQNRVLVGHSSAILCVVFSPDGSHLVSSTYQKAARIWSLKSEDQTYKELQGHSDTVNSVAYSFDGTLIVSASADKALRVWNAETGTEVGRPLTEHKIAVTAAIFTPNGKYIISGSSDGSVYVWDAHEDFKMLQILQGHHDLITAIAAYPDSKYALSSSRDNTAYVWDLEGGNFTGLPLIGHSNIILSIAASPNGKYIATGSLDTTIRIWNFPVTESTPDSSENRFLHCYSPQPYCHSNGWYTHEQDLFFWIPPALFSFVHTPYTHSIFGKRQIKIDLSDYVHGTEWTECGPKL